MNVHQTQTEFNCGIDLHAKSMYICVMNREGEILRHQNIKNNDFAYFLKVVEPFRHDLTVACECTFNWYWLCDDCYDAEICFSLGHALYMKVIHGTKTKNDRVDSKKIAHLLRSNLLPKAYCCSAERRPARELLRRRIYMMRERSALLAHMSSAVQTYGQDTLTTAEKRKNDRQELIPKRFDNELLKLSMQVDVEMVEQLDMQIAKMEKTIVKHTKLTSSAEYNLLKSSPGIGTILALIILYEVDDISRFPTVGDFCSYARLAPNNAQSAGKTVGKQGRKMGNQYLKWAFTQAVVLTKSSNSPLKRYCDRLTAKHGKLKSNTVMAHRLARAVYFMLKRGQVFDMKLFLKGKINMT